MLVKCVWELHYISQPSHFVTDHIKSIEIWTTKYLCGDLYKYLGVQVTTASGAVEYVA